MIALGSRKRWYIGSWILTALLLAGFNCFKFISMFDPILVGYSDEIRLASQKWRRFEESNSSTRINSIDLDYNQAFLKFIKGVKNQEETASGPQETGEAVAKKADKITPPILAGIIGFSDVHGNERLLAVIEGGAYKEKAEFQGYTINEITRKGIVLKKAGSTCFVPVRKVHFSIDRSGLTDRKQSDISNE